MNEKAQFFLTTSEYGMRTREYEVRTHEYGERTRDHGRRTRDHGRRTRDHGRRTRDHGRRTREYFEWLAVIELRIAAEHSSKASECPMRVKERADERAAQYQHLDFERL